MKKTIFTLLSGIFITACTLNEQIDPIYKPDLQDATGTLKATVLSDLSALNIRNPLGLVKQGEQFIIGNPDSRSNAVSLHLETGKKRELFPRGLRASGALYPTSLSASGNSGTTILDIYRGKLLYALSGNTPSTKTTEKSPSSLPAGQQHLAAVQAGDYIVATGLYEQGRYLLFRPSDDQAGYFLDYPAHPVFPDLSERTKSVLYASSVLKIRPDNRTFVCADKYSGLLDICRIDGEHISRIRQHVFHHPKVYIHEKTGENPYVAYSKDNCFGFTDITVSQDRIYALYSGKTYRRNNTDFQQCQTLLILDWEGNILNTYHVDTPLTYLQYEAEENAIYAIGYTPKTSLVKIDL